MNHSSGQEAKAFEKRTAFGGKLATGKGSCSLWLFYSRGMPLGNLVFPDISIVYGRFAALTDVSADLGGWLLLYARLDGDGVAVAMASNVAGAASLGIEPDAERAKAALRAGVCDFVVNDLGEALRILKNEIRQRRAVSVVLTDGVDSAVAEIVARGVQPEVLAFAEPVLEARGARVLALEGGGDRIPVVWSVDREPMRWLPVLDGLAVGVLEKKDARVRWVEASPRYLGRMFAGQRFLRMSEGESNTFVAAVRGAIPIGVSISRGGEVVLIDP